MALYTLMRPDKNFPVLNLLAFALALAFAFALAAALGAAHGRLNFCLRVPFSFFSGAFACFSPSKPARKLAIIAAGSFALGSNCFCALVPAPHAGTCTTSVACWDAGGTGPFSKASCVALGFSCGCKFTWPACWPSLLLCWLTRRQRPN